VAFDITKADIDFVLKNAPANPPDGSSASSTRATIAA
jgi:hypothetical protein